VKTVIAECIRATGKDETRLQNVVAQLKGLRGTFGWAAAIFVDTKKVRSLIVLAADAMKSETPDPKIEGLIRDFVHGYLDQWHTLPSSVRASAATKVADGLVPLVLQRAAAALAPLVKDMTLGSLADATLTVESLQRALRQTARKVRAGNTAPSPGVRSAYASFVAYVGAYLSAWYALPEPVRLRAADAVVASTAPRILDTIVDVAWENRERLMAVDELAASDGFKRILGYVAEQAAARADSVESQAISVLEDQLGRQGPDEFVTVLRDRTQEQLDWIKVNGTAWGSMLGATSGLVMALVEHL
jgi:hypothetical protein